MDASKAESESDEIVNQYLDKTIESTDDFLEKFVALRKTMYLRRVKLDKMREIIQNPQSQRTPARKAPEPPPAAAYTPPTFGGGYPAVPPNNWGTPAANLPYPIKPNVGIPNPNYRWKIQDLPRAFFYMISCISVPKS